MDLNKTSQDILANLSEEERLATIKILKDLSEKGKSKTLDKLYYADFEEVPVDIDTFIESDKYIGWFTNNGKDIYPYWREQLRNIFNKGRSYSEIALTGCLSGETKIPLLNGTSPTIEELYNKHFLNPKNNGKDTIEYVYSFDTSSNKFTVGELVRVFYTGEKDIYKITLDNGETVTCTDTHPFMTRDKHWKTIKNGLSVGDSLMPFNRDVDSKGYEEIYHPQKDGTFIKENTHRMCMRYIYGDKYKGCTHHRDFNKLNNDPTNLVKTKWSSHRKYHRIKGSNLIQNKYKRGEISREEYIKITRPNCIKGNKSRWNNPEQHRIASIKTSERMKRFCNDNRNYASELSNKFWSNKDTEFRKQWAREKLFKNYSPSEYNKYYHPNVKNLLKISENSIINSLKEVYNYRQLCSIYNISETGLQSLFKRYDINPDNYTKESPIDFPNRYWSSRFNIYNKVYSKYNDINDNLLRKEGYTNGVSMPSMVINKYFNGNKEDFIEVVSNYNHKVVSIEYVGKQKTYDLTVKNYHNFCLDCGLVSKNSIGIGKSTIAVIGLAYCLYRLMCLKDPHDYYHIGKGGFIYIVFFNLTLQLSQGVAYTKFQSLLQNSPWFMERGQVTGKKYLEYIPNGPIRFTVGSTVEHSLGKDIFCMSGDTIILTENGLERLEDMSGQYRKVYSQNSEGELELSSEPVLIIETKKVSELYEIELEDGTILKCTNNHLLKLKDGSYKRVDELSENDELSDITPYEFIDYWKQFNIKSEHYMNRYINFIKVIQNKGKRNLEHIEKHHIVPKSYGQNDDIIELTPREHFIAHHILMRALGGKMVFAFHRMCHCERYKGSINSRIYEELRIKNSKQISENLKGKEFSDAHKKRLSEFRKTCIGDKNPMYGKKGNKCPHYGKVAMTDGLSHIYVNKNNIEEYKMKGYVIGKNNQVGDNIRKSKTKYIFTYDNKEFYGWRSIQKYLKSNGYNKISEMTIMKLSKNIPVKGYDSLIGHISLKEVVCHENL